MHPFACEIKRASEKCDLSDLGLATELLPVKSLFCGFLMNRVRGSTIDRTVIRRQMENKHILELANKAVANGDYELFLSFCTDDTKWTFVEDQILLGKEAVRAYMKSTYIKPPEFNVERILADGDFVIAIGEISLPDDKGKLMDYSYCDVWKFREGKMAELKAFVIAKSKKD
jgi:ketosteroid isomerase-like protein